MSGAADMRLDLNNIVSTVKQIVGLAAVIMISVGVLRAFGVSLDFLRIGQTELAALAASAAYVSR